MENNTKFLLDSGDPQEYKEISQLAKQNGSELWGSTTNPSLIAKSASWRIAGKKISQKEAFELQKQIVIEILDIVPGAVSAEVYADERTSAEEMIEQGREIAKWHSRVIVKLPTTLEGFKARTVLRKEHVPINNTLVFSQQQIFAICLHEQLVRKERGPIQNLYPPFISPFAGRLDDISEDGMSLVENGMKIKKGFTAGSNSISLWMLAASIRNIQHIKRSIDLKSELLTAPAKIYREWFGMKESEQDSLDVSSYASALKKPDLWIAPMELRLIETIEQFMQAIETNKLNIRHPLTDKGLIRFTNDWKAIIS